MTTNPVHITIERQAGSSPPRYSAQLGSITGWGPTPSEAVINFTRSLEASNESRRAELFVSLADDERTAAKGGG